MRVVLGVTTLSVNPKFFIPDDASNGTAIFHLLFPHRLSVSFLHHKSYTPDSHRYPDSCPTNSSRLECLAIAGSQLCSLPIDVRWNGNDDEALSVFHGPSCISFLFLFLFLSLLMYNALYTNLSNMGISLHKPPTESEGASGSIDSRQTGGGQASQEGTWFQIARRRHRRHGESSALRNIVDLLGQAYGGMRGIKGLVWEPSLLDADEVWINLLMERFHMLPAGNPLPWNDDPRMSRQAAQGCWW